MLRDWSGIMLPVLAALVTLVATWFSAMAAVPQAQDVSWQGVALLLLLPAPLVVAVVWGSALLAARTWGPAVWTAGGWLVLALALWPAGVVWQMAGNVAAGLAAGIALGRGWRLDAAILGVTAMLVPILVWAVLQVPLVEQTRLVSDQLLEMLELNLPEGADEAQREQALAVEKERLDRMAVWAARLYPSVVGIGVLGQAGIILGLLRLVARRRRWPLPGWGVPPFMRWRLPFYLVWIVVAGIGLVLTRRPPLTDVGMNLALMAALILSLQGLAVQVFVTTRMLPPVARVVYWAVMGVFLVLLVMVSSVVLGLADQWWDLRRLDAVPTDTDGSDDGTANE